MLKNSIIAPIHSKKKTEIPISFVDKKSKIFQKIKIILKKEDRDILNKINQIIDKLTQFNIFKRPSHGGLHHGNLIDIDEKIQLIDWEASSIEDPAYDIARLFCVSDFSEENKGKKSFLLNLNSFFKSPTSTTLVRTPNSQMQPR